MVRKTIKRVKRHKSFQTLIVVIVVVIIAIVGVYLINSSHAATPYVASTADKGTTAGTTTTGACNGAKDGNCVTLGSSSTGTSGSGCSADPPAVGSTFEGDQLTSIYTGAQLLAGEGGYGNYGTINPTTDPGGDGLPPGGTEAASHAVAGPDNALEIQGYNDPQYGPGVVGSAFQLDTNNNSPPTAPASGGGFTYCYSMSGANWAPDVAIVFIAWPQNQVWGDGEIDFLWTGAPSQQQQGDQNQAEWDVVTADGCTTTCQTPYSGVYPTNLGGIGNGEHTASTLWAPGAGDTIYGDGQEITNVPSADNETPSGNEDAVVQLQDEELDGNVSQSSPLKVDIYWIASYSK